MVGHATRRERVEVRAPGHDLRCAAVTIAAEIRAREHHHEGLLREVFLRGRDGAALREAWAKYVKCPGIFFVYFSIWKTALGMVWIDFRRS